MIDEIHITNINDWPPEAQEQFVETLSSKGIDFKAGLGRWVIQLDESAPKLKRESLYNDVQKTLHKAEVDHGLEATVKAIESTSKDDREDAEFTTGNES